MKPNRHPILIAAAGLLAFAAGAQAQDKVTRFTTGDGTQVILQSGQPKPDHYGPPPAFAQLDTNHDGFVSREEAEAYIPLLNDFDYLAHHSNRISKRQFENWVQTQGR
jgi:hypothetical protein